MRFPFRAVLSTCALLALIPVSSAQQTGGAAPPVSRPVSGPQVLADLGLPALPVLGSNPRRDSLRDVDRIEVRPSPLQQAALTVSGTAPIDAILDESYTGTGFHEYYTYQVPPGYDSNGLPIPMLIVYHGFGSSASSVDAQTLLDELCALHGWFYLSVTGVDDKLFGTDVAQRNVDALIRYIMDEYTIDADRLYMVGFSMGAGVTANYAATHRDPEDIMIAAVGLVSGAYDWAMTYEVDPTVQSWLLNPYNFGATPTQDLFAYQRASGLHHDVASYLPTPGVLVPDRSLAWNLEDIPTWITWDLGDTLTHLPAQSDHLTELLQTRGAEHITRPVTGTVDPGSGLPATHSWAVMDPVLLFHFFDGRQVRRRPSDVNVLLDEDTALSFLELVQETPGAFTEVTASVDPSAKTIDLEDSENLGSVVFNMDSSGLANVWPVEVTATAAEEHDLFLTIQDDADLPGYLVDLATGDLVGGSEWDSATRSLTVTIPGLSTARYLAEGAPWGTSLSMSPDPVAPGQDFTVRVHSPAGAGTLWMILSTQEGLLPVAPGVLLAVSPFPPALLQPLALDAQGDLEMTVTMPNDPALSGLRLSFQGAVVPMGGWIVDTSNPFGLDIL
jgi:pimeloyl-ACP methyl ester carboxylesterase